MHQKLMTNLVLSESAKKKDIQVEYLIQVSWSRTSFT